MSSFRNSDKAGRGSDSDGAGICPGCHATGRVGIECIDSGCVKLQLHYIPAKYVDIGIRPHHHLDMFVGRIIGDHLVVNRLGAGGFGSVYLALQTPIMMETALKVLNSSAITDKEAHQFEREAAALAKLTHPNIVRLIRFGFHSHIPYMVTELVKGGRDLAEVEQERWVTGHSFSPSEIRHVTSQLGNALSAAHAHGIVHRDVKPQNIMVQPVEGDSMFVRVLDFGLAKLLADGTNTGVIRGTPAYMAPEQYFGQNIGPWTDLYAAGVVVLEMILGGRLFAGRTHEELMRKKMGRLDAVTCDLHRAVPVEVTDVFAEILSPQVARRPSSGDAFVTQVASALDALEQQPVQVRPVGVGNLSQDNVSGSSARPMEDLFGEGETEDAISAGVDVERRPNSRDGLLDFSWRRLALFVLPALALVTAAVYFASHRGNSEFLLSEKTAGHQILPRLSRLPNGRFVSIWEDSPGTGTNSRIVGRLFSAEGVALSPEFGVSTKEETDKSAPAIASCLDGRFLAVWLSSGQDGSGWGVYAQWFNSDGAPVRTEFLVNADQPLGDQELPDAACSPAGWMLVVWQSQPTESTPFALFAQLFSVDGTRSGGEFPISTSGSGIQRYPAIAAGSDEAFLVVWEGDSRTGGDDYGIAGQLVSSDGTMIGEQLQINTHVVGQQRYPCVATMGHTGFVVAWTSVDQDGSGRGVYAQRLDSRASRVGEEFQLNLSTVGHQWLPVVAATGDDSFLAAWISVNHDGSGHHAVARAFGKDGLPTVPEFTLGDETSGDQVVRDVEFAGGRRFVIAWEWEGHDGDGWGVYGKVVTGPVGIEEPNPP